LLSFFQERKGVFCELRSSIQYNTRRFIQNYLLSILKYPATPAMLGRRNMKKKILMGISAAALLTLLMVGAASACVRYGPGLSPGFWKHNVGVKLGLENGAYSDPGYTGDIVSKATMGTWLDQWTPQQLLDLYNALNTKGGGSVGAAARVDAANFFNLAAGLSPY
jgi:hypothetical protein